MLGVQDLLVQKLWINVGKEWFSLSEESRHLTCNRMDLEHKRPYTIVCIKCLEMVVEKPLSAFHPNIDVQAANDNTPQFIRSITDSNI